MYIGLIMWLFIKLLMYCSALRCCHPPVQWPSGAVTLWLLWPSGYCDPPVTVVLWLLWLSSYFCSPVAVACGLQPVAVTCDVSQMIEVPFTVRSHWKSGSFWLLSNGLSMGTDVPAMLGSVTCAAVEAWYRCVHAYWAGYLYRRFLC